MHTFSAVSAGIIGFGLTCPALARGAVRMELMLTQGMSSPNTSRVAFASENGASSFSGSVLVSSVVTLVVSAQTYMTIIDGLFVVSATGNIGVMARASTGTAAIHIAVGSFIKAYKIG
jgi:hypothetical protein